ncbi:MAG: hypothetical protein A2007_03615 [Verrucomicrobia bacterium GWC2_42_7]|nr:MAG: hypothetical protein A2007_03615 [Verrucomicrobia bacterium GWC2_42_7]
MRKPCLWVVIVNRWCRWVLFSLLVAYFFENFEWCDKSIWQVGSGVFIGWFLMEMAYHWYAIRSFSYSELPLFPKYFSSDNSEWPNSPQFIELRADLRKHGFKHATSLLLSFGQFASFKSAVFENADSTIRVQVLFMPRRMGGIMAHFSFMSLVANNKRYMTDNVSLPFGGFYPDNWSVVRRPLVSSFSKLLSIHNEKIKKDFQNIVSWKDVDVLEDLNQQQRQLERINIQNGFINESHLQDEFGQLTQLGRYRLCKEVWKMRYLGRV